jgi:hypothetical protein
LTSSQMLSNFKQKKYENNSESVDTQKSYDRRPERLHSRGIN